MALVVKDRVRETSTSTGTGAFTLDGPVAGFQSFSAIGTGNTTYYTIVNGTTQWEVGIGTWTSPNQLTRNFVSSSSTGSLINFTAGTKDVFVTFPVEGFKQPPPFGASVPNTINGTTITGTTLVGNQVRSYGRFTVDDTSWSGYTAELGVDANGFAVIGGALTVGGTINQAILAPAGLQLGDSNTAVVTINAAPTFPYSLNFPPAAGSNNQLLKTDGSGNLGWMDLGSPPAIGGTTPNAITATNLTVNTQQVFNPATPGNIGTAHQVMVDGDGTYDVLDIYMDDGGGGKYPPRFSGGIITNGFALLSPDYVTNYQYVNMVCQSGMSSPYTLTLPATAGSANQVLKTDGAGNLSWTNKFVLGAGTATAGTAPLKFTSGTNLTTAEAGAMEYDGTVAYFTPSGTARALNFTPYYFRNNSQVTLNNATGNQSVLGLTNGVTLAASTIYEVECEFKLTTSGTTSHTEAFGFAGTATANNVHISMTRQTSLLGTGTAGNFAWFYTTITVSTVTPAITTAQEVTYKLRGNISVNASGTFRPVIAFSAAPGGTSTIAAGAWFRVTPLGASGSNISIGTWS